MAVIYITSKPYNSTVKCFETKNIHEADLLYFSVDKRYKASGEEKWFFTDKPFQADCKVFLVDQSYMANLNIFKVDKSYLAKWQKEHPLMGQLGL